MNNSVNAITALGAVVAAILGLVLSQTAAEQYSKGIAALVFAAIVVVQAVSAARKQRQSVPVAPPASNQAAYLRGLQPFNIGEQLPRREAELQRLNATLGDEEFRVGLVLGEPGSGRTSFLRAGLLTQLSKNDAGFSWMFVRTRGAPLAEQLAVTPVRSAAAATPATVDPEELIKTLRSAGRRLLVVFDDFDTMWTDPSPALSRAKELAWLKSFVESDLPVVCLLVLRTDIPEPLRELESILGVVPARSRFELHRFEPSVARDILSFLSAHDGAGFEATLTESVSRDLCFEDGVCPAELQIVGSWLREHQVQRVYDYQLAGASRGILTSIVEDKLDEVSNRELACRVLARFAAETRGAGWNTGLQLSDFAHDTSADAAASTAEVGRVIDLMVADRLAVPTGSGGYRLVHRYFGDIVAEAARESPAAGMEVRRRLAAEYASNTRPIQALALLSLLGLLAYGVLLAKGPLLDGQRLATLQAAGTRLNAELVAFDPSGQYVAVFGSYVDSGARKREISIWQLPSFHPFKSIALDSLPDTFVAYQFAFDPDGQSLALYSSDGEFGAWSLSSGEAVDASTSWHPLLDNDTAASCPADDRAVALSGNRELLAVGLSCGQVLVYDLVARTRQNIFPAPENSKCAPSQLVFGQAGRMLFARYPCGGTAETSQARWWSLAPPYAWQAADDPAAKQNFKGTVFGADGNPRGVVQTNARTEVIDFIAGSPEGSWPLPSDWEDNSGGVSSDGMLLAVGRGFDGVDIYRQPIVGAAAVSATLHLLGASVSD